MKKVSERNKIRFNGNGHLGLKHSQETKDKIRVKALGRKPSQETLLKMRASHLGLKRSPESIAKTSGVNHGCYGKPLSDERKAKISGSNHYLWQGDKANYNAAHLWMNRHEKKPDACERCGLNTKLDWANVGQYTRHRKDYLALCRSCHFKMDEQEFRLTGRHRGLEAMGRVSREVEK